MADETRDDWIRKNVYPVSVKTIGRKIQDDYQAFLDYRKNECRTDKAKSETWYAKVNEFNARMTAKAYDVRNRDTKYEKMLEKEYGVTMITEDHSFYEDNCHGQYISKCSTTVPRNWLKQRKRVEERTRSDESKQKETEEAKNMQKELDRMELMNCVDPLQVTSEDLTVAVPDAVASLPPRGPNTRQEGQQEQFP